MDVRVARRAVHDVLSLRRRRRTRARAARVFEPNARYDALFSRPRRCVQTRRRELSASRTTRRTVHDVHRRERGLVTKNVAFTLLQIVQSALTSSNRTIYSFSSPLAPSSPPPSPFCTSPRCLPVASASSPVETVPRARAPFAIGPARRAVHRTPRVRRRRERRRPTPPRRRFARRASRRARVGECRPASPVSRRRRRTTDDVNPKSRLKSTRSARVERRAIHEDARARDGRRCARNAPWMRFARCDAPHRETSTRDGER